MGSVGDCYDNAMAESFFATLETELIDRSDWATPAEAKAAVFDYIEVFYNRIRRHSSLGNLSPEQFEERYRSSSGRRGRMTHHRPRNRGNSTSGSVGPSTPDLAEVARGEIVGELPADCVLGVGDGLAGLRVEPLHEVPVEECVLAACRTDRGDRVAHRRSP